MPADTSYHGELAHLFPEHASQHPTNAYIDRPAMLGLLGDIAGLDVLDVGCGPGFYAAAMLDRGAKVTGVDGSPELLEYAREATGSRATLLQHYLEDPFTFAEDSSYDLVLMALVYSHVYDRAQLLAETMRVLRPGGRLLLSNTHPTAEQRWLGGSYYVGGRVDALINGGPLSINFERMSLERLLTELLDAGFILERVLEPRPIEDLKPRDPERYELLSANPAVLTLALRRL